jgi:hypothetical protein
MAMRKANVNSTTQAGSSNLAKPMRGRSILSKPVCLVVRSNAAATVALASSMLAATVSYAQQPPPMQPQTVPVQPQAQPYPTQPQAQPYPTQPQPYPAQPYPTQPQPYPAQPYPAQPYPTQPQPYPAQPFPAQPQPQPYPAQPYPPPAQPYPAQAQPPAQPSSNLRGRDEMASLYVAGGAYGVFTGIWLDSLFKIHDPGAAIILPLTLGAAAPIGIWAWDEHGGSFRRGVPASIATGTLLGGVEGLAIVGTQWQYTRDEGKDWSFQTQSSVMWLMATGGGLGGWAFGEWVQPDPRSMTFIGSSAAWGALSGGMFGIAVQGRNADWKDGSSVAGLVGYNVGILGGGAISLLHTPSYNSQKYMWAGYGLGALAGCLVFPFYLFVDDPVYKRGLIGPAFGGIAGTAIAGALTWDMRDDDGTLPSNRAWQPPFNVSVTPPPAVAPLATTQTASSQSIASMAGPEARFALPPPGAMLSAVGSF